MGLARGEYVWIAESDDYADGGADESLRLCGDWKLWAAMALTGKVVYLAEPLNSFMRTVTSRTGTNLAERFTGSLVDPGASDTAGITCRRPRSEARTGEALYGPGLSELSRFPKHHSSGSSTRAGTWGHEWTTPLFSTRKGELARRMIG